MLVTEEVRRETKERWMINHAKKKIREASDLLADAVGCFEYLELEPPEALIQAAMDVEELEI